MFLGNKVRPVRRADNLATICEPIVLNISQPYRPPLPVKGQRYFLLQNNFCSVFVGLL
jgi:hypothetical protein